MNESTDHKLLQRRAAALAQPVGTAVEQGETLDVLLFSLRSEVYGLEARYAREVFAMKHYTPVPSTPTFVAGVTSLHGEILSLVDLGHFFAQPRLALTNLNKVLVVESEDLVFGILIDEPMGIEHVPLDQLRDAPAGTGDGRKSYIRGLTPGNAAVLDMASLLRSKRLIVGGQWIAGSATGEE